MRKHGLPHLVSERGVVVVGYAYAVLFWKRPAYRYTVKHSIYVHPDHLHSGVGKMLLPALIDACAAAGYRQMIGYIEAANTPSIHLHEQSGFRQVGYLPSVGYKFGHWTDVVMVQRSLAAGATTAPDAWLVPPTEDGLRRIDRRLPAQGDWSMRLTFRAALLPTGFDPNKPGQHHALEWSGLKQVKSAAAGVALVAIISKRRLPRRRSYDR